MNAVRQDLGTTEVALIGLLIFVSLFLPTSLSRNKQSSPIFLRTVPDSIILAQTSSM